MHSIRQGKKNRLIAAYATLIFVVLMGGFTAATLNSGVLSWQNKKAIMETVSISVITAFISLVLERRGVGQEKKRADVSKVAQNKLYNWSRGRGKVHRGV